MQKNNFDYINIFSNISELLSFYSKAKDCVSDIESLYSIPENDFCTYSGSFIENVKLHNLYCNSDDIIEYNKELSLSLKKLDSSIYDDLSDKIQKEMDDDYNLLSDLIEMYRDGFLEALDIKSIEYRKKYFTDVLNKEPESRDYYKDLSNEDLSLMVLEETLLGEAIMEIDIKEDCWVGTSGGYFAPVSSDYFDNLFYDIDSSACSLNDILEDIKEELEECSLTYNEDSFTLINNKTNDSISIFSKNNKEISKFLQSAILNKTCHSNFESYFENHSVVLDSVKEDMSILTELKKNFKNNVDALNFIFKYTEKECEKLNKKENFISYINESYSINEIILDAEEKVGSLLKNNTNAIKP